MGGSLLNKGSILNKEKNIISYWRSQVGRGWGEGRGLINKIKMKWGWVVDDDGYNCIFKQYIWKGKNNFVDLRSSRNQSLFTLHSTLIFTLSFICLLFSFWRPVSLQALLKISVLCIIPFPFIFKVDLKYARYIPLSPPDTSHILWSYISITLQTRWS